jgi:hypothetical protein
MSERTDHSIAFEYQCALMQDNIDEDNAWAIACARSPHSATATVDAQRTNPRETTPPTQSHTDGGPTSFLQSQMADAQTVDHFIVYGPRRTIDRRGHQPTARRTTRVLFRPSQPGLHLLDTLHSMFAAHGAVQGVVFGHGVSREMGPSSPPVEEEASNVEPYRGATQCCAICQSDIKRGHEVRVLPCGHKFHATSTHCSSGGVDYWLRTHQTCPTCRRRIAPL